MQFSPAVQAIHEIVPLDDEEALAIDQYFEPLLLKKGALWIKEGQYCNEVVFVSKGTMRVFYHDENGNEITCFFVSENNFVSSYASFLTQTPTKENIETIDEAELYVLGREEMEDLSARFPKIQIFRRIIAENLYLLMERRIAMLQSQTAQARYEQMIKEDGELMQKIPLQYIASFLGITPQHLSRLRKNKDQGIF
jgi:CRP-like cAMP-binding protein